MNPKTILIVCVTGLFLYLGRADRTITEDETSESMKQSPHDDKIMFGSNNRSLNQSKQQNCAISGSISCKVLSGDIHTDCKDIRAREDLCHTIPILMTYTYCNDEVLKKNVIIIDPSLTSGTLYANNRVSLDSSDLQAGKCRSVQQFGEINTCTRSNINAAMQVNGWKSFKHNAGSYCSLYNHYSHTINKFNKASTQALVPLQPDYTLSLRCHLESFRENNIFSVPCDEISQKYFDNSSPAKGQFDYIRNVKYEFIVRNQGNETIKISSMAILIENTENTIFGNEVLVETSQQRIVATFTKTVNFSSYFGKVFSVQADISAVGVMSNDVITKRATNGLSIP